MYAFGGSRLPIGGTNVPAKTCRGGRRVEDEDEAKHAEHTMPTASAARTRRVWFTAPWTPSAARWFLYSRGVAESIPQREVSLEQAFELLMHVRDAAVGQGLPVAAAIVDRGGHTVASARMD